MTKARDLADRTAADITAVTAGTGISISSGAGPIPTVTNTVATGFDAKGDLIVGTGADTFSKLTVASTAGHVLTVDSAEATGLKWAAPATSTSGFTFITRSTFSNVATADLDNIFTSTYETYQIVIEECFGAATTDDLLVQLRYAGPTTQTADYYGRNAVLTATYEANFTNGGSSLLLCNNIRTSAAQASSGSFYITNVGNGSRNPIGHFIGFSGENLAINASGFYQSTARVYTGLRFLLSANNITARIAVYGLAKA